MKYSLQLFNDLSSVNVYNSLVSHEMLEILKSLKNEVCSPGYNKTPVFPLTNNVSKKHKKKKNIEIVDDETWFKPEFKTTDIVKNEGIQLSISNIRGLINKLTDKNYKKISSQIIVEINDAVESGGCGEEDAMNLSNCVFDIASTNKFYSDVYSSLFAELINTFSIIRKVYLTNVDTYTNLFTKIEYCNPEEDYNRFCEITKYNDKRRALSTFFVNLVKKNILEPSRLFEITKNITNMLLEYLSQSDKKNEVDEIVENISILYDEDIFRTNNDDVYTKENLSLPQLLKKITAYKLSEYPSLTSKTKFKCMDILHM